MNLKIILIALVWGAQSLAAAHGGHGMGYRAQLNHIKDGDGSVVEKLNAINALVYETYQNIDGTLSEEATGMRTASIAAAGRLAQEVFNEAKDESDEAKAALEEVLETVKFVRCYSQDIKNYNALMEALAAEDTRRIAGMLGNSIMCLKMTGLGKITAKDGSILTLETVAGKSPAAQEWHGDDANVDQYIMRGTNLEGHEEIIRIG